MIEYLVVYALGVASPYLWKKFLYPWIKVKLIERAEIWKTERKES